MSNKAQDDNRTNGRWTRQEHEKFILGLQLYGKDWKKIQALIATRNGAQIRSHAQKFFIKVKKQFEPTQMNDHWEQTKESPPEYLSQQSSLANAQAQSETRVQYSYYLNKIVQKDALKQTFDFWGSLIDHKPIQEMENIGDQKRKNSFVSISSQKCDRNGSEPIKKIKCE